MTMADSSFADRPIADDPGSTGRAPASRFDRLFGPALHVLASLRITVTLLALSLFLVLAGTLAQVNADIWEVVHTYFRTWFAYIPLRDLLPHTWFGPGTPVDWDVQSIEGGFWFPGGWLLGAGLAVNQIASMLTKFKVKVRGTMLWVGLATTAAGAAITWAVVVSGMSGAAAQDEPLLGFGAMWNLFRVTSAAAGIGLSVWTLRALFDPVRRREPATILIAAGAVGGLGLALWALFQGAVSDGSARILWNLMKATFAAGILLAGLMPIFGRQGGTFLLHCGLLMLLGSEFYTGVAAKQPTQEAAIFLREGDRVDYLSDARRFELALISETPQGDRHAVISDDALFAAAKSGEPLDDPALPLIVTPISLFGNVKVVDPGVDGALKAPADVLGEPDYALLEVPEGVGVGSSETDQPGGLFRLTTRDGAVLGTALLSTGHTTLRSLLDPIPVTVETADGPVRVQLRYTRKYLPYAVGLKQVRAEMYPGTSTARTYESDLLLTPLPDRAAFGSVGAGAGGAAFPAFIKMNNPLRYGGRTFYQQNFYQAAPAFGQPRGTGLQIVTNDGWMVPYVACMVLAVGMLAQFLMSLIRFLGRRGPLPAGAQARATPVGDSEMPSPRDEPGTGRWGWAFPLAVVVVLGGYAVSKWRAPDDYRGPNKAEATASSATNDGFDLDAFGKIPVLHGGRLQPIDSVARNALKAINGNKQEFEIVADPTPAQIAEGADPTEKVFTKAPALRWFLDLIADPPQLANHRVLRIPNGQVLGTFGLKERDKLTYALGEFPDDFTRRLSDRIDEIRGPDGKGEPEGADERAFGDLEQQLGVLNELMAAFDPDAVGPRGDTYLEYGPQLTDYARRYQQFWQAGRVPLAVPRGPRWETFAHADVQERVEADLPEIFELETQLQRLAATGELPPGRRRSSRPSPTPCGPGWTRSAPVSRRC